MVGVKRVCKQVYTAKQLLVCDFKGTSSAFRGLRGVDALALCDRSSEATMAECEWREVDYAEVS